MTFPGSLPFVRQADNANTDLLGVFENQERIFGNRISARVKNAVHSSHRVRMSATKVTKF
jgi:hypothetical protein